MRIVTLLVLCAVLCCSQGHEQEECLNQNILLPMIKQMINTLKLIEKSLPKENAPSHRILGNLAKESCSKNLNVADIKRILDIYDKYVFQNNNDLLPEEFTNSFARLRGQVKICETKGKQTLSPCVKKKLNKIKKNLKMRKDLSKAQREFSSVLVWISNIMGRSRTHETH